MFAISIWLLLNTAIQSLPLLIKRDACNAVVNTNSAQSHNPSLSRCVDRAIVGRRFFFLQGMLYLYRMVTMYITTLPVPSMHMECAPKVSAAQQNISTVPGSRHKKREITKCDFISFSFKMLLFYGPYPHSSVDKKECMKLE